MSNSLPISELISLKNLTVELSFLETSGSSLLNKIRYDDYKIEYSKDNNGGGSFLLQLLFPRLILDMVLKIQSIKNYCGLSLIYNSTLSVLGK